MREKPVSAQMENAYEAFLLACIDAWTTKVDELKAENERMREGIMAIYMPLHGKELRGVGQKLHALLRERA